MFIKETHIELSDGDTCVVSNDKCPLTEKQADELEINIVINNDKIPCCICEASLESGDFRNQCPHYYGYIKSVDKGEFFDCRINDKKD